MPRSHTAPRATQALRQRLLAAAVLAATTVPALASIGLPQDGDGFPAELVLTIWDPVAKASYTYDTGVAMASFLDVAQTDAGYQRFWTLDPANDRALARFVQPGTAKERLLWFVAGVSVTGFGTDPGDVSVVTTLRATTIQGQTSQAYSQLLARPSMEYMADAQSSMAVYFSDLNNDASNALNFHGARGPGARPDNFAYNGSSYTVEGQQGYVDGPTQPWRMSAAAGIDLTNPVGRSSWFYHLQSQADTAEITAPVIVDEFDNLTNDGYWGLDILDGRYILSYSLFTTGPSAAQRAFAASVGRTELNGGFRVTALAGVAALATEGRATIASRPVSLGAVTLDAVTAPVPEPASVALMAVGAAAVAAAAARRRTRA
ncbi:PEP-CTERM sorting domain-containing protein [uncultured Aquincola sp.]|uniref:PEP-CTERM sorting domain-containing protein n=1 Tax=uncultured Aquincola sp. TaxID=886556 RepID=UPI0032B28A94